jgi:hypothetical protein
MVAVGAAHAYDPPMLHSETQETRTLTVVLPESEWRALRDAEPDALGWLQRQIRNRLSSAEAKAAPAVPTYSTEDEY